MEPAIAAHPSNWSTRQQRDHAAVNGRGAWQTSDTELALRIQCAALAVAEAMPHLDIDAILNPPHAWFDAALARQIMVFVLVHEMNVPKRQVVAVGLLSREMVLRGLRTIEARRQAERFDTALTHICAQASHFHQAARTF